MTTAIAPSQLSLPYRSVEEAREELVMMTEPQELASLFKALKREVSLVEDAIRYQCLSLGVIRAWFYARRASRRLRLLSRISDAIVERIHELPSSHPEVRP